MLSTTISASESASSNPFTVTHFIPFVPSLCLSSCDSRLFDYQIMCVQFVALCHTDSSGRSALNRHQIDVSVKSSG